MSGHPEVSVVIPLLNEADILPELICRLLGVLDQIKADYEIIFVDDGSRDASHAILAKAASGDSRIRVTRLSRNFGQQIAATAGIDRARGDVLVLMDGDLQDPPELIPDLLERWRAGYQVVYAVKARRKESWFKRMIFSGFYRVIKRIAQVEMPADAGTFSAFDRRVADVLRASPESQRYIAGLRAWAGFKQTGVVFDRGARAAGQPRQSYARLLHLALDGIFAFSDVPLRMSSWLGLTVSLLAVGMAIVIVGIKLLSNKAIPGWASNMTTISFLGGIQLLTIGILGQYLGRVYEEVKRRPLYVVAEELNAPEEGKGPG
jgi:glycosyltransferase involved in cell wall biosynthesis